MDNEQRLHEMDNEQRLREFVTHAPLAEAYQGILHDLRQNVLSASEAAKLLDQHDWQTVAEQEAMLGFLQERLDATLSLISDVMVKVFLRRLRGEEVE